MGLADEFERRLERAVEGFFSKAFRSRIQPAEVGRRLLREMEASKTVSVGAVYVANRYEILLAPADHERFEGLTPTLAEEFSGLLEARARERHWRFPGDVLIEFSAAEHLEEGRYEIRAQADAKAKGREAAPFSFPWLRVMLDGQEREFALEGETMVIGRLGSCEIVLADTNVSRRHAQLTKRPDGWWISDLGSTNGTLVNGSLARERRLEPGDVIQVGSTELAFGQGS